MTQPPMSPESLRPVLQAAEQELSERLEQACTNKSVSEETTGELMRLEENLIDAAQAAKQAISLRRRIRTQRAAQGTAPTRTERRGSRSAASAPAPAPASVPPPGAADAAPASTPTAEAEPAAPSVSPAAAPAAAPDAAAPRPAMREFADAAGKQWRVWAVTPEQMHRRTRSEAYMGEYRDGWLAFESFDGEDRRRLPHYPADWDRLEVAELERLMAKAEVARGRKPSPPRGTDLTQR